MNLWQKIGKLLLTALCCGVLLTTACSGNPEKQDIIALAKVFKDYEGKDQEFQQKIKTVQTQEDIKGVIAEYLPLFEKTPQELRQLTMKSEEGKKLQTELADSYEKIANITRKMLNSDLTDQQAMLEISKESTEVQMQMQKTVARISQLAGKHGLVK
ncbi:MAG: hypothetical protein J5680_07760 [Neisseriaceae bacterium]|nr:hypothetical protein [Neisseriaceae bacterium]